jgi:hypothetical protein
MKAIGFVAAFGAALLLAQGTRAGDPVDAKAAFASLKTLAGEWKADEGDLKVAYKVTANGSVVMETFFPGTDHEMVSMYHLDGDTLRMTHYCASGNQPHTKLDVKASKPELLVFAFDGGTNFDPAKDMHMHEGRIKIKDAKHIETEWDGFNGGKKSGTHKFVLTRP